MSATLTVRHTVADYAAWRPVYDNVESLRAEYGCTGEQVYRDPADANDLFVTHDFPSVEQATAFAHDPKLAAAMQNAGVTSAPRIEIFEVV
jgi:quinol monooxygenase YgiN